MPIHIALLRAVNVGGANRVPMAELKAMLAGLGFARPQTLLQSGNAVFESDGPEGDALEAVLEDTLAERLGVGTAVRVRTAAQWAQLVAANPFPDEARADPGHLLVMFLQAAPSTDAVEELRQAIKGPERVIAHGREAYVVYPEGIGRSKLTPAMLERRLGAGGTGRNWNTVLKLAAMAGVRSGAGSG
jgi:uncharacterized protein (DUF1697 family)